jgi:hypothetical protein
VHYSPPTCSLCPTDTVYPCSDTHQCQSTKGEDMNIGILMTATAQSVDLARYGSNVAALGFDSF